MVGFSGSTAGREPCATAEPAAIKTVAITPRPKAHISVRLGGTIRVAMPHNPFIIWLYKTIAPPARPSEVEMRLRDHIAGPRLLLHRKFLSAAKLIPPPKFGRSPADSSPLKRLSFRIRTGQNGSALAVTSFRYTGSIV